MDEGSSRHRKPTHCSDVSYKLLYYLYENSAPTLARLLTPAEIERQVAPASLRCGSAISRRRGVEFIERSPRKVIAWVGGLKGSVAEGGSQRRHTCLSSTAADLSWHCIGNPKQHQIFCKHSVALALAIKKSRKRST